MINEPRPTVFCKFERRAFLKLVGVVGLSSLAMTITACAPASAPTEAPKPAAPAPKPTAPPPVPPAAATAPAAKVPTTAPTTAPTVAKAPEKVSLRLDFLIRGHHAPFYVALDKGWYRERGLDVTIGEGRGSGPTVQQVAAGTDTFGWATSDAVILAAAQGAPAMMVAGILRKYGGGIAVLEDSGIKDPKDFEGKRVGTVPGATTTQLIAPFFKSTGVDSAKVTVISVDAAAKDQSFFDKRYEGVTVLLNSEPITYRSKGFSTRTFVYGDYGVTLVGYGVVVNPKTVQEKPDVVKGFVDGAIRGHKHAFENPQDAAKILKRLMPEAPDEAVTAAILQETAKLTDTPNTKGKPMGVMSDKDWQDSIDNLAQYGTLKDKPDLNKLFTNNLVPGA